MVVGFENDSYRFASISSSTPNKPNIEQPIVKETTGTTSPGVQSKPFRTRHLDTFQEQILPQLEVPF